MEVSGAGGRAGTVPSWAAACGVNVVRAAHAELVVTDLQRAADFYGGLLGFVETERNAEALYYRGYEEREHHSLILRRGARPAVSHIAFRLARPDDLAVLEERFRDRGLAVRRIPAGGERGQGAAVRVQDPCGLPVELYHEMETVGRQLQQYHLHRGAPIMRLDHFNCQVTDVASATDWYMSELGFGLIEYAEADTAAHDLWAAWLWRKHSVHDLAVMNGVGPRLHHVGFSVPDALAVLRACDVLAAAGAAQAIERGPGRHGLSNALFVYLRDPDGHRIELYTGDYLTADPDWTPIRWSLNDPRRATFWGHAPPACWFEEASPVLSVVDGSPLAQRPPLLIDRPDFVT